MPNILDDLASGGDGPMQRAQRGMRPVLQKRFYKVASVGEAGGGFEVLLDGTSVKTPAKRALVVPSRALAEALAAEWTAQGDTIDPAAMPLTKLVNVAIDRVADEPGPVADEIAKYSGSDLVCYRAGNPEGLVAAQSEAWNPVIDWAREELGARFICSEGVQHVAQSAEALAAVRAAIGTIKSPLALAALASATALSGSALIALALARGRLSADEAWNAAHVDEHWNIARWGEDEEAVQRLASRRADFDAAAKVLGLV